MQRKHYSHPVYGTCTILDIDMPPEQVMIRQRYTNRCIMVSKSNLTEIDRPPSGLGMLINKLLSWIRRSN